MKAVFDTNILIDFLNGVPEAKEELDRFEGRLVSIVTFIEVLVGARDSEEENAIRRLLSTFEIVAVSAPIAETSIALRKAHRLKIPDAIVYATAKESGCLLVTRNTKDMQQDWPDIRVPYAIR